LNKNIPISIKHKLKPNGKTNEITSITNHIDREFIASPSPFMLWMKPIVVAAEQGSVTFKYTVREEMSNPVKSLHGGVTAAIADDCIGATMFSLDEETFYTTINLVVDYFAPAFVGDTILAKTAIIRKGKQIVNAHNAKYGIKIKPD
jgi:acyl-coenzyme A thioesterase 13